MSLEVCKMGQVGWGWRYLKWGSVGGTQSGEGRVVLEVLKVGQVGWGWRYSKWGRYGSGGGTQSGAAKVVGYHWRYAKWGR